MLTDAELLVAHGAHRYYREVVALYWSYLLARVVTVEEVDDALDRLNHRTTTPEPNLKHF